MARKTMLEELAEMPWWVSVVMAALVYVGARWIAPALAGSSVAGKIIHDTSVAIAPYAAILFLIPAPFAALRGWRRGRLFESARDDAAIRSIPWPEFEALVAMAYGRLGYSVEERGGRGRDGGVDIVLREQGRTTLVQCKHWNRQQVGVSIVRELYGVINHEHADAGVIVTGGMFTADGVAFAKGKPIELVNGEKLLELLSYARGPVAPQEPKWGTHRAAPTCPTCNALMIMRTAKRGSNVGSRFWGCTRYPQCRGTRPIGEGGVASP